MTAWLPGIIISDCLLAMELFTGALNSNENCSYNFFKILKMHIHKQCFQDIKLGLWKLPECSILHYLPHTPAVETTDWMSCWLLIFFPPEPIGSWVKNAILRPGYIFFLLTMTDIHYSSCTSPNLNSHKSTGW